MTTAPGAGDPSMTIWFMLCLAGAAVVGFYFLMNASHALMVIVENTASGVNEVRWPDEPFLDWLWKPLFLTWLLAAWLAGGWLLLYLAAPDFAQTLLGFTSVLLFVVWLLFPISLYSSLSARSLFAILSGSILRRVARRLPSLMMLYVLTAPVLLAMAGLVYLAAWRGFLYLLLAAPVLPVLIFWHARLLGRYAWLIGYRTTVKDKKGKKKRQSEDEEDIYRDPWVMPQPELQGEVAGAAYEDPHALDEPDDEWAPNKKPYGVLSDEKARRSWQGPRGKEVERDPYLLAEPESRSKAPLPLDGYRPVGEETPPEDMENVPARLRIRILPEKPPQFLYFSGVWEFPFYQQSLRPWLNMTAIGLILLSFLRAAVYTMPVQ